MPEIEGIVENIARWRPGNGRCFSNRLFPQ